MTGLITLEERIKEKLPELRKEKKEWTTKELIDAMGLSDTCMSRTRVIDKLRHIQNNRNDFEIKKCHFHGLGWKVIFPEPKK